MNISVFKRDKLNNDLNFKLWESIGVFFDFLLCREKVHDQIEVSRGNSKPNRHSRIKMH